MKQLVALTVFAALTVPLSNTTCASEPPAPTIDGIVVSGHENCRKPFPEFYQILFSRYNVTPESTLFIDDNIKNIDGAKAVGLQTIHFKSPEQLKDELKSLSIL